ncbi:hypothetical protein ACTJJ0_02835 [Chitinophaga sp. 22321]|uniref:Uncharacterized protein n=1 Tax=Chitinophaga hostae TaxID=2831022 RepID=A0ABS5IU66_9BACT|nr:hypothetical protein [Chitinophaga hostae]MBS0026513.1 hypothetical protein [Chitinophaga hostae]
MMNSSSANTFRFNPVHLNRSYGVTYAIETAGSLQTISYEITVCCTRKYNGSQFLFEINKGQVYIDNEAPEKMIDKLAETCGKVLYPLQVAVNEDGQFTAVANQPQIAAAWEAAKPGVLQYYTGVVTADIVAYMDLAVSSAAHIYQSLCRDWFMALYFSNIYQPGSDIMERSIAAALPVMPYGTPVTFKVSQKPVQHNTDSGCLILQQKGSCDDPRSLEDLLQDKDIPLSQQLYGIHTPLKGSLDLTYKLYHKDFSINAIIGECRLSLDAGQEKKINISLYHLREKDKAPAPVMQVVMPDAGTAEKKKGFFAAFFKR